MSDKVQLERAKLDEFIKLNQYFLEELKQSKTNVNKFEVAEWLIDLGKVIEDAVEEMPSPSTSDKEANVAMAKSVEERLEHLELTVHGLNGGGGVCSWAFFRQSDSRCFRMTKLFLFICHVITTLAVLFVLSYYIRFVTKYYSYSDKKLEELHPDTLATMSEEDIDTFRTKQKIYLVLMLVVSAVLYHLQLLILFGVYVESKIILIIYLVVATLLAILSIFSFTFGSYLSAILVMVGITGFYLYLICTKTKLARLA